MRVDVNTFVVVNPTIDIYTKQAVFEALQLGAEYLLTESLKRSPHDEGTLDASAKTSSDFMKMTSAVSYDTPYAVRLHEHPEYSFQGKGEGKWLERTLQDKSLELQVLIASRIRAYIDQGGGI